MHQSRRSFIQTTGMLVAGVSLFKNDLFIPAKKKELVGIQLYSVRDDMKKDPLGTLKQLAEMGYKNVEHANYIDRKFYGYSVSDFKKILGDLGMKMPSGHTVMFPKHWDADKKDFTDEWKHTVEDAAMMDQQYVISPWLDASCRKSHDELLKFMDVFNKCGELCKKSGMKFGYHNHDFEFSEKLNGEILYDLMLKHTDPDLVIQQLDTGNLYNGGAVAIDWVKKYPGRFASLHVKDEIAVAGSHGKYESTILGNGIVNLKEVVDAVRKKTRKVHYIIEQEAYQGKTPLECAKEDLRVMKTWGY